MVVPAQAFWACPAVGNCSCTGFAIENALHVSIFDAFCYQNDKMTHCALPIEATRACSFRTFTARAKTIARPATKEYAKAPAP